MFFQLKSFDPSASGSTISTQAGIIVGAKTAAMCCTGMLWGRAADSEWGGRKLVLLIGLLSSGTVQMNVYIEQNSTDIFYQASQPLDMAFLRLSSLQ